MKRAGITGLSLIAIAFAACSGPAKADFVNRITHGALSIEEADPPTIYNGTLPFEIPTTVFDGAGTLKFTYDLQASGTATSDVLASGFTGHLRASGTPGTGGGDGAHGLSLDILSETFARISLLSPGESDQYYGTAGYDIKFHVAPGDEIGIHGGAGIYNPNEPSPVWLGSSVGNNFNVPGDYEVQYYAPWQYIGNSFSLNHPYGVVTAADFEVFIIRGDNSTEDSYIDIDPEGGITTNPLSIPEPSSVALLAFGLAGVMGFVRINCGRGKNKN